MERTSLTILACALSLAGLTQSIERSVIAASGGSFTAGGYSLSSTMGEPMTATFSDGANILTQGFQQPDAPPPTVPNTYFITTWKSDNSGPSGPTSIAIPTFPGETYDYDVDWTFNGVAFNAESSNVTGDITHDYGAAGTYVVAIRGTFPRIYFNGDGDHYKLLSVDQWGDIAWSSMESAFGGCSNLVIAASAGAPDLSAATSTAYMFFECPLQGSDLSAWDVSQITDMSGMFSDAMTFTSDLSAWDVGNVVNMSGMFSGAFTFNSDLSAWDVSNVTNMAQLFFYAASFTSDLSTWNVSQVTDMHAMFRGASTFNGDISTWNVANVTDMSLMFNNASAFTGDLSAWNVSQVESMPVMFGGASLFHSDLSSWDVSSVTDMHSMFDDCFSFNSDISVWDVSQVTDMSGMFSNDSAFDQDLGDWDIGNITDMQDIFYGVTLSTSNYDALLNGWHTDASGVAGDGIDDVPGGITFHGGNSMYCAGTNARQDLITSHGWNITQDGGQDPGCGSVLLAAKVLLQGPYNGGTGLMNDDLRSNSLVPLTEPYTALGYGQVSGGGETVAPSVLAVTGNDAIVDWVFIELRDKSDNTAVVATRCALVQRDGDVVDVDGTSPVTFAAPADNYYVAVRHRNHFGVLTLGTVALAGTPAVVDLTDGSRPTYGTDAQADASGTKLLWSGDVNGDGLIKYTGAANDRDPILVNIGGTVPTNTTSGYYAEDVNMDGLVKYTGSSNDRDPILVNIGGTVPTAVRSEQMP